MIGLVRQVFERSLGVRVRRQDRAEGREPQRVGWGWGREGREGDRGPRGVWAWDRGAEPVCVVWRWSLLGVAACVRGCGGQVSSCCAHFVFCGLW